jgi:hypothetical protein
MNTKTRTAIAAAAMTMLAATSIATAAPSHADSTTCVSTGGKLGITSAAIGNQCLDTPMDPWLPIGDLLENIDLAWNGDPIR